MSYENDCDWLSWYNTGGSLSLVHSFFPPEICIARSGESLLASRKREIGGGQLTMSVYWTAAAIIVVDDEDEDDLRSKVKWYFLLKFLFACVF